MYVRHDVRTGEYEERASSSVAKSRGIQGRPEGVESLGPTDPRLVRAETFRETFAHLMKLAQQPER